MTDATVRDVLGGLPLLHGATGADLDRVATWAQSTRFSAGATILRRGEPADTFHVVVEGRVALTLHVAGRGDLTVETMGPGDVVGVSWAAPPHRWDLDAVARDDVKTIAVDGARLRLLTEGDDPLGSVVLRGVTRLLGERLHATRLRLADLYGEPGQ